MELQGFIEKFCQELEIEDLEQVNGDTEFHQLDEWSSLAGLTIMGFCLDAYNVTITADEIRNTETIEELFNLVKSKV